MALIKRANASDIASQAVVLDLGDLRRQAELLKQQARDDAEKIKEEALDERAKIMGGIKEVAHDVGKREGYAAGLEEGRAAGHAEALAQQSEALAQLISGWNNALDQFDSARADLLEQTRKDLLAFVVEVASRVTRSLVELDNTAVQRQLEAALALVVEPSRLVVEVHPEDREVAQAALPALLARYTNNTNAELVDAPHITRGSCVLRTDAGRIDASIEHQLQSIAKCILGEGNPIAKQPEAAPDSDDTQTPPIEDRSAA